VDWDRVWRATSWRDSHYHPASDIQLVQKAASDRHYLNMQIMGRSRPLCNNKNQEFASKTTCVLMEWTFFRLTNTSSSIDGAIILICVPSIAPTTPGMPAIAMKLVLILCSCWLSKGNWINCCMICGLEQWFPTGGSRTRFQCVARLWQEKKKFRKMTML